MTKKEAKAFRNVQVQEVLRLDGKIRKEKKRKRRNWSLINGLYEALDDAIVGLRRAQREVKN